MKWSATKKLAYGFYYFCTAILTMAMAWAIYHGLKNSSDEKAICERLNGELINQSGPTECVKQIIRYTPQEKANASR